MFRQMQWDRSHLNNIPAAVATYAVPVSINQKMEPSFQKPRFGLQDAVCSTVPSVI
jgi:hypothetical protein